MPRFVVVGFAVVLMACPKEQVNESRGETTGAATTASDGVSTTSAVPTTGAPGGSTTEGPVSTDGSSGGSSGAIDASSGGAASGTGTSTGEGTSTGGTSTGGTSSGESSSTGEAALLFDCFGCTCDAHVSFCRQVFAGFAAPERRACPIVPEEGLASGCVLFPVDCDPPSCACLPTMNKNCFCTEQGPGVFEVTCPLP